MNLPEDKNERNKILALIAIGVIAVCYVTYNFGVKTVLQKRQVSIVKIADLEQKLWRAKLDIQQTPKYMKENSQTIDNIIDISENRLDILHPNLGNFLLVAEDVIERHANSLNLKIKNIKRMEQPVRFISDNDDNKDPKAPRFSSYTVNVEMNCSFYDLIKLISSLEKQNKYLCITRLGVIGQPDNKMEHSISFDVQWPIWVDARHPMKLVAQQMISKSRQ